VGAECSLDEEAASFPGTWLMGSDGRFRRPGSPPPWVWLFAATGFALLMPAVAESSHYTPLPSLERHALDWSYVLVHAMLVLVLPGGGGT
jgi:hypothetical protein